MIYVRNVIDKSITMLKYIKLNKIINFDEKDYYYINNTNVYLTININWKRRVIIVLINFTTTTTLILTRINLVELYIMTSIIKSIIVLIVTIYIVVLIIFLKNTISNDIIIYEILSKTQHKLQNITKIFLIIWKNNNNIMNVLKKNWILIKTIFEIKSKLSRVYSIKFQNCNFIDKKFNKLHCEKK